MYMPSMERQMSLFAFDLVAGPKRKGIRLTGEETETRIGLIHFKTKKTFASSRDPPSRPLVGLKPGVASNDLSRIVRPFAADTFSNRLAAGHTQPDNFHWLVGWAHYNPEWDALSGWILEKYEDILKAIVMFYAMRATRSGLETNPTMFIALAERYNCHTGTFFMPGGEMGLALHEMYEVSTLPWSEEPYEEYTPTNKELRELGGENPELHTPAREETTFTYVFVQVKRLEKLMHQ